MQTILVPTDFSTAALNAADYAADMSATLGKNMVLLYVYTIPVMYSELPVAMNVDEMMKSAEERLTTIKTRLLTRTGGKVKIETTVKLGSFLQELINLCEQVEPYAVVMGSQGTTAGERFFFGGHTVAAIQQLVWPVITVPPGAVYTAIRKVALACDLNSVKDTVPAEHVKQLVNDLGATLHVVNIGEKEVFNPGNIAEAVVLRKMLSDLHPQYHFITHNNIYEGLIEYVANNQVDLLMVFPKHHSFPESLLHKSQSKQMVLNSPVPVIALH